jgi:hypothetical protein
MAVSRRLVAAFAADVEGHSRLMGADEVGTLRGLTERRAILDGIIGEHRGRIANTAGDSVLAEFGSAVDAVQCAAEAQTALAEANSGLAPERRISFRIGTLSDFLFKTCVACFFLSRCLTNHFISSSSFRASPNNARICLRSAIASPVNRPCLRAFWFALGAPDPGAPPCMRQRFLPRTAGERHAPSERVLAPQRGLASIGPVFLM